MWINWNETRAIKPMSFILMGLENGPNLQVIRKLLHLYSHWRERENKYISLTGCLYVRTGNRLLGIDLGQLTKAN